MSSVGGAVFAQVLGVLGLTTSAVLKQFLFLLIHPGKVPPVKLPRARQFSFHLDNVSFFILSPEHCYCQDRGWFLSQLRGKPSRRLTLGNWVIQKRHRMLDQLPVINQSEGGLELGCPADQIALTSGILGRYVFLNLLPSTVPLHEADIKTVSC